MATSPLMGKNEGHISADTILNDRHGVSDEAKIYKNKCFD
jgi:hypothetical protein